MTAGPDALAAALAPDLVAIIAHLAADATEPGRPVTGPPGLDASARSFGQASVAGFNWAWRAWAAGTGPVPSWQSWAHQLAGALDALLAEPHPAPPPDHGQAR